MLICDHSNMIKNATLGLELRSTCIINKCCIFLRTDYLWQKEEGTAVYSMLSAEWLKRREYLLYGG